MGDNGGSEPTKTAIGRARANGDEKESFKFIVPPNRETSEGWEKLPVKNIFIWLNLDVFKLNLIVQFVLRAEMMKTKNKYMTAMFAAFQKTPLLPRHA